MKIYKYIGDGAGIPGLPHAIPEDEAAEYGAVFQSALEAGAYKLESSAGAGASRPEPERASRKNKKADDSAAEGE